MATDSKDKYTNKPKRQADHIEESYVKKGVAEEEAERRVWASVNKHSAGGIKPGAGLRHNNAASVYSTNGTNGTNGTKRT